MRISYSVSECTEIGVRCTRSLSVRFDIEDSKNDITINTDGTAVINGENFDDLIRVSIENALQ